MKIKNTHANLPVDRYQNKNIKP